MALKHDSRFRVADLFAIDQSPRRGLLALEWVVVAYLALTLVQVFFCYTQMVNPESMIWGRFRALAMTGALWLVYRLVPCRLTLLARVVGQLALLSWWYPDTYELNRIFPNMDHLFAGWEQALFGCQPAWVFCEKVPWPWFSELMGLGYTAYYPMIVAVLLFCFFVRYDRFEQVATIILGSFFAYYVIFVLLPVTGPQFYYQAVGADSVARGVFPSLGDYFRTHQECLPIPGWTDGFFHHLVQRAHDAGERPTAAFPSSHVGVTTVLMFLAWKSCSRWLFFLMLPLFVLMFFATVYIRAHYAIDAVAGLVTGSIFFFVGQALTRHLITNTRHS